jgi:hypothetical protein
MPDRRRRAVVKGYETRSLIVRLREYRRVNDGWASLATLMTKPTEQTILTCWHEASKLNDKEGEQLAGKLFHITKMERDFILLQVNNGGSEAEGTGGDAGDLN